jgi:hypothetical protein
VAHSVWAIDEPGINASHFAIASLAEAKQNKGPAVWHGDDRRDNKYRDGGISRSRKRESQCNYY